MKVKQYRKILLLVLMICAAILFGCVERALGRQLSTQQIASEWSAEGSYAQITCFFSKDAAVTKDYVIQLEQKLKTALQEASEDTSDVNGRTLVDCYSTKGELTLYSDRASITARAFGVGGDFFTFHPLKLLSGSYFDGEDLNKTVWSLMKMLHGSYLVPTMSQECMWKSTEYSIRCAVW